MASKAAVVFLFGVNAYSAQTNTYLFTGSETNIILHPGIYEITAYGAQGGGNFSKNKIGGMGAKMGAKFNITTTTMITLLVGGAGAYSYTGFTAGGGGGGSFVVTDTAPLVVAGGGGGAGPGQYGGGNGAYGLVGSSGGAGGGFGGPGGTNGGGGTWGGNFGGGGGGGYSGDSIGYYGGSSFLNGGSAGTVRLSGGYGGGGGGGAAGTGGGGGGGYSGGGGGGSDYLNGSPGGGGGSYVDSSAVAVLAEVSGVASPDGSLNGEIIIVAVSEPEILNYRVSEGKLVLEWAQGLLLSAGAADGNYTQVSGASSPYTNFMSDAQQFFRVLVGTNSGVSQSQ